MRLIDADALIPMMKYATTDSEIGVFPIKIGFNDIEKVINEQPTVDTARHGHWIYRSFVDDWIGLLYICSECRDFCDSRYRFCPSCGAKMDGFEEIWEDDRDRLD